MKSSNTLTLCFLQHRHMFSTRFLGSHDHNVCFCRGSIIASSAKFMVMHKNPSLIKEPNEQDAEGNICAIRSTCSCFPCAASCSHGLRGWLLPHNSRAEQAHILEHHFHTTPSPMPPDISPYKTPMLITIEFLLHSNFAFKAPRVCTWSKS